MQVKKDKIKNKITEIAKAEFQEKGFANASMRKIAKKVGISVSNIYNYFRGKDEIFKEIVSPTILLSDQLIERYFFNDNLDNCSNNFTIENSWQKTKVLFIFLDKHRSNLELLLFKSQCSEYENTKDKYIDLFTELYLKNLTLLKTFNNELNSNVSDWFIHNIVSFYFNIINEIIMHDLSKKEMEQYAEEINTFLFHGWLAVLKR
ncbi:MAG: TetR/AcrR family transcriptional regulator [Bacteroidales bacterium]|nr:TetR/AcrR family transcriptional regulator [Bacteroidales bacterium]